MTMTCGTAVELLEDSGSGSPSRGRMSGWMKSVGPAAGRSLLGAIFILAAILKLAATEFEVNSFRHFGYALWFMYVIGGMELAGGVMLLTPSLAALGALAMMPIMVGAAFSHLYAGDPALMTAPSLLLLGLLGSLAYARRSDITGS